MRDVHEAMLYVGKLISLEVRNQVSREVFASRVFHTLKSSIISTIRSSGFRELEILSPLDMDRYWLMQDRKRAIRGKQIGI